MKYLVLGAGVAGVTAAEEIRRNDKTAEITMFSAEKTLPYSRPMLTKMALRFAGNREMPLHDEKWYEDMGIKLVLGADVESMDTAAKTVTVNGKAWSYDRCVYALGCFNHVPPFPGKDRKEFFTLRTWDDIRGIKRQAVRSKKAVVIGGGVIGLEAALALQEYGMEVTVLEALPYLMPRLIDKDTSDELIGHLDGIRIETGVKIKAITGDPDLEAVELEDGRRFECTIIVASCGVRANLKIAADAGIECGRSVKVNEYMETSAPGVYACGDCAEYMGVNYSLWSQALEQGRVAGINAAGGREKIGVVDCSLVLNSPKIALFSLGDLGKQEGVEYTKEVIESRGEPGFVINPRYAESVTRKYYANGKLVGASIVGNLSGMYELKKEILGE